MNPTPPPPRAPGSSPPAADAAAAAAAQKNAAAEAACASATGLRHGNDNGNGSNGQFSLNSLIRSRRWFAWLIRLTQLIRLTARRHGHTPDSYSYCWLDLRHERWLHRLRCLSGPGRFSSRHNRSAPVAWPGPVWSRASPGQPLLSWFVAPVSDASPQAFATAIQHALEQHATRHQPFAVSAEITRLMQRVLHADALPARHQHARRVVRIVSRKRPATRVLLLDERAATHGMAAAPVRHARAQFERMLRVAQRAHPDADFWLVQSTESGSGPWLAATSPALPRATQQMEPHAAFHALLEDVDHVYTVAAPEGMLALLAGVPLHVFGMPYYAGWGLTHDHPAQPERPMRPLRPAAGSTRSARPTVAALFEVVFVQLARYLDPATHQPGSLENLLDSIEWQNTLRRRYRGLRQVAGVGFQWWKRPFATPFLCAGGAQLRWTDASDVFQPDESAVLWGARSAVGLAEQVPVVRIEDGFFHSAGLGSEMSPPYSQVLDSRGMYFDPSCPSDLTMLLNKGVFGREERARAAALRRLVVHSGVTKYNLGRRQPGWHAPAGKTIVLVPGQVADDASVRLGSRGISTIEALLEAVRAHRPEAWLVYKPHPDVLSGNRPGLIAAQQHVDVVDTEADLLSLIELADEVHTLSSLAGFDALLRGKAVFTYGLPFYAGWGLTRDMLAQPWRERPLSLDMLVAGVLLRYPLYWDWRTQLYTTPEAVVRQLAPLAARPLQAPRGNARRRLLKVLRWSRNALRHLAWRGAQWRHARKASR
ncbi:capsular biosynthesis protein [Paraburkholderia bonniea]|uniref:capsular polysaccharide export protein, LipB/KpsS family n=1 Tax=Paraburkholderia bonniea TaxID=2152891 RepID=UPI001290C5D1|nr:capsular biosynthesis protein [Paraburkholderia bonniea]